MKGEIQTLPEWCANQKESPHNAKIKLAERVGLKWRGLYNNIERKIVVTYKGKTALFIQQAGDDLDDFGG